MATQEALDDFRAETRDWLAANCPDGARGPGMVPTGSTKVEIKDPDVRLWLDRMIERGWTVPTWPKEYGGAAMDADHAAVLNQEMVRISARAPTGGMGTSMIGPTLLEYGTEEQKAEHLPRIARAEVHWCQGYSEPGSGSDLASLRTQAVDHGDHFLLNGQKIWTSSAHIADWMFALVRTDNDAPKHLGISFVMLSMDQPGVTVRPIPLIDGTAHFCETFFDNAVATKANLVGELNEGWTVGKRLLQFERSAGVSGGGANRSRAVGATVDPDPLEVARAYVGERDGRIDDPAWRARLAKFQMDTAAYGFTQRRVIEESAGGAASAASSMFKRYGSTLTSQRYDMLNQMLGTSGLSLDKDNFSHLEVETTRTFLASRAVTIYGGSNEVQANILAKRVLGLPD